MNSDTILPRGVEVSADSEFDHYIRSLASSSSRSRYIMIIAAVVSLLIFVAYRNASITGWLDSRLQLPNLALEYQLWRFTSIDDVRQFLERENIEEPPDWTLILTAYRWLKGRGLKGDADIRGFRDQLQQTEINHIIYPTVPVLGLRFDVNDLGVFGGLALIILMFLLFYSISREHENVLLALWRVRTIVRDEEKARPGHGFNNNASCANLLYHALAMAQVLSRPPTLVRWRRHSGHVLSKALALAPLVVLTLVFLQDFGTRHMAIIINPIQTRINLWMEGVSLAILAILLVLCLIYSRAIDLEWRYTFFYVNPHRKEEVQSSWWERLNCRSVESVGGVREEDFGGSDAFREPQEGA